MAVNTNNQVTISEANQDFSRIARMADELGSVVILKNSVPRYILMEYKQSQLPDAVSDKELMASSEKLMRRNLQVYEELAK